MIAALFALAAAMIIGGCAAVIQGFPYVRLESGLAMVIAGSVAASSGAVLCGLGVLALGFRRVERAIEQSPEFGAAAAAPVGDSRIRPPSSLPAAPAFIVPPPVEPPLGSDRQRLDPGLDLQMGARVPEEPSPVRAPKPADPVPDLRIPVPPLVARDPDPRPDLPRAAGANSPEDDLFAAPEAPQDAPPALRPALDTVPAPEEPAPKPATRNVVGRYASGGNTYVMFEDGSIEAETPQGRFTFASLDELKAFVDGGGESGNRGAA